MPPTLQLGRCVVLLGPDLAPHWCDRLVVCGDTLETLEVGAPCRSLDHGALVVMPGMYNSHTHMGDSCLPDGATGMTLEQGFFRPDGYKYRELAKRSEPEHVQHIAAHLRYMARTGTVGHVDFREQGVHGSRMLRRASAETGVRSVVLGQFDSLPFSHGDLLGNTAGLTAAAREEMEAVLTLADGFSESTINDLTDPAWEEIRLASERHGKLRAIHCLENDGYRSASLAITGRGDLERAIAVFQPHLVIHVTAANDDEIALLSAHRLNVALNPRANATLGLQMPPIARLMRSNANLLLGTDNGLLNSPNLLAELDFTYKVAKSQFGDAVHPDPAAILRMVTSNIRHLLPDVPGYLEKGLPADLVLLDFTQPHLRATRHIVASVVTRVTPDDVLGTMRAGKWLYRNERLSAAGW